MTTFVYSPGEQVAICAGRMAVLLDLPIDHELVAAVDAALRGSEPTVDLVLDILVSLGLRAAPTFAIAEVASAGMRVVVRGEARASVDGADDVVPNGLWENRFLDGASAATLHREEHVSQKLPLDGGVVLASSLYVGSGPAKAMRPVHAPQRSVPMADEGPAANPDIPTAPVQQENPPSAAEDASGKNIEPPAADLAGSDDPPTQSDSADGDDQPAAEATADPDGDAEALPDFDHLFGETQAMPAQQSAPEPETVPELESESTAAPETLDPLEWELETFSASGERAHSPGNAPMTRGNSAAPDAEGAPSGAGLIRAFPWGEARPSAAVDAQPSPQLVASVPAAPMAAPEPVAPQRTRTGMTIDRDQLIEHGGASAPMVVAARCANGHLSPAYAGVCRVCGKQLPAQQPFEVTRPPLGALRLVTGDTVLLDRGVILGRSPYLPPDWTGEQPNLVKIHDPDRDVSGQHLEVKLDFWHVLVRDLGSTNGTEIVLPGGKAVTLRPHDAMMIEPGTRIILAGVFEVVFEVAG